MQGGKPQTTPASQSCSRTCGFLSIQPVLCRHHMKRLLPYLKSLIQALLLFILISVAVDWWRKPNQPMQASSESLRVINGSSTSLETLSKERVAVVYFWGTWCHICSYTSPTIDRLHQNGIPTLGVAVHSGSDTEIQSYMKEHQLQFPTVNDSDDQLAVNWKIAVTPTIILIKNGKMIHHTSGLSSYWGLRSRIWLMNLFY